MERYSKEGEQRRSVKLLQRQLAKRFGQLPAWVNLRLEQATLLELEQWSLQILEVKRLEKVFEPNGEN